MSEDRIAVTLVPVAVEYGGRNWNHLTHTGDRVFIPIDKDEDIPDGKYGRAFFEAKADAESFGKGFVEIRLDEMQVRVRRVHPDDMPKDVDVDW